MRQHSAFPSLSPGLGSLYAGTLQLARPLAVMAVSSILSGAVTIAIALAAITGVSLDLLVFYAAMAIMGGATAFMMVPYRTIVQRTAPLDRIARVFAAGEAVTVVVMLSAPFIGGVIAELLGIGAAFLAGGAIVAALGVQTLGRSFLRRR